MLARNLLYTGVTRGKRLVVIIGQRKALGIAVGGGQTSHAGRNCGSGFHCEITTDLNGRSQCSREQIF